MLPKGENYVILAISLGMICITCQKLRYYFGVGGGSMEFMNALKHCGRDLDARVVAVFEDGSSNTREIIQVTAGAL